MRNFKASTLKSLKIRNIGVEERDIHYRELTGDQPNNSSVRLYLFDNFLSSAECFGLMNAHNNHVSAANGEIGPIICFSDAGSMRNYMNEAGMTLQLTENDFSAGTTCVNATISNQIGQFIKWSYSTSFYPGESVFSKRFDTRIEKATGLKSSNGGKFQLTSYPRGVGYKPHTDCIVGSTEKRDRFATILVYLQDVPKGGETVFSELNISVRPIQGRALVWNNMDSDGKCQPLSLHEAAPVIRGSKYIIQRWYYYESFYALGKRSAEPELPPRVQDQPRVSCDKYEQGSCRWYDEWNFDHIKEYQRLKRDLH
uniref:Uncharacterized protein LOC102803100 n=1 Tax=Saccoglossus kowalevskii TaxID=10224 RepID=A0ABM0MZI0_SACKO|nr:PREDICTED: uncharacterized protein LOC102803100 [Saccoglossus kowalevskii]